MATEHQLSGVLSDFARTMGTDFPIQAILDHLVLRIVDVLPVTSAGVTLIAPGQRPRYIAASDDSALRFEELQTDLQEGPCIEAYESGQAVSVPDVARSDRFPTFVDGAIAAGIVAVFAFPLRDGDERLGALDLYCSTPGLLGEEDMAAAQTLADVAAAYLLNAQARTDLREAADRSRQTALHDALTGLPNRVLFLEHLDHAVARASRSAALSAVLFADLDRFKEVNDEHGHRIGDHLLVAVARRLAGSLRPGDTLARLSGDEFVVLCEDLEDVDEAGAIAGRIVEAVDRPFHIEGVTVATSASVGIAFAGPGTRLSESLLDDADTAMYQAKRKGGRRHQVIDLRERHLASERTRMEQDLQGACSRGELRMEYQPVVRTGDRRVVGFEALLRWRHPTGGEVPPMTFIPMAEARGLMPEIGRWALESSCTDRDRWPTRTDGLQAFVSVNVSAHQLMARDFDATVAAVLEATGTSAKHLVLEVTETAFVQDSERALLVLQQLRRSGVSLALDDFGTGYSSLAYLRDFPMDVVKVDRSFVAAVRRSPADRAIVTSIIDLAHALGKLTVAEGVETAEQHEWLAAAGCDYSQGFLFARSVPAARVPEILAAAEL